MKHLQPNTRKYLTFGLIPVKSSYGVLFLSLRRYSLLEAGHVVLMASAQSLYGDLYSSSIVLAISIRVIFFLSATPFFLRSIGRGILMFDPLITQELIHCVIIELGTIVTSNSHNLTIVDVELLWQMI